TMISPANDSRFRVPVDIDLSAIATDAEVNLTTVEFYQGGIKLGETTNIPYHLIWSNVPAGLYQLSARAFDYTGDSSFSLPISITVAPPYRWLSIERTNGSFAFDLEDLGGSSYVLEATTNFAI